MSQELKSKKNRKRSDYGYQLEYRLRLTDNDWYNHVNNSVYSFLIDSIINAYLLENCGLGKGPQIGLVVHSYCDYFGSVSYPSVVELGMRVLKIGKSSVAYEVGVFEKGNESVKAVGGFVHVFVAKESMRPLKDGMDEKTKVGLEKLLVKDKAKL